MLAYVSRSGPPAAMLCPVFLCDACMEPIQSVAGPGKAGGIVQWVDHADGTQTVVTTHKGECGEAWSSRQVAPVYWEELDVMLDQLTWNSTEPFAVEDGVEYVAPAPSRWRLGRRVREA